MAGQGTRRVAVAPEYNYVDNAGFELNQRGGATYTANGAVTLDRWVISLGGSSTVTVSQIASTIGSAGKSAQLAYTHVAAGSLVLFQNVEDYTQLRGRAVTFAVTVKSTVNGTVRLQIADGVTTTSSAYNVGTGSQRLVVSAMIGAAVTLCQLGIRCDVATCTVEANDATLVVGGVPADYAPLHPAQDLARCQRYYESHGGLNPSLNVLGYGAATANNGNVIMFHATKFATPTMTKSGTWNVTNCGQPSAGVPSVDGYTLFAAVTALGSYAFNCNSADDTITAETNP